ncbi:prevent-host-death protein [Sulfurospirillum sp. 1307]|jgi:PHD/YefM family antitoxin component YafN of YafNO toxin-antitoxin module
MTITANEVKKNGVSIFNKMLDKFDELIINVRGKDRFVVIDIERYKEFRANELDIAYIKAMKDIEKGKFKIQSSDEHIKELVDAL